MKKIFNYILKLNERCLIDTKMIDQSYLGSAFWSHFIYDRYLFPQLWSTNKPEEIGLYFQLFWLAIVNIVTDLRLV